MRKGVADVAATRDAGTGGRHGSAARGRRGRRPGPEAPEVREAPGGAGADRARDMVMVDPGGALLAGLLEAPFKGEEAMEPAGAGPAPGKGAAKKKR